MDLVNELKSRGLVEHASADLEKILGEQRTLYVGTDPTADSLHVGHLAWVVLLRRLSDAGHKIILLVGGGTGLIGDPKEKGERPLQSEEAIANNAVALQNQLRSLIGEADGFVMVNNAEWLREVSLLPFLRDVGKHFTVNDLIKRDLIRRRLETPDDSISYTEFTYSLLQAYDFWELNQRYGCDLQIGASDQWTNILSGVDLIRKRAGKEVFALAIPLITDASGRKFGKSEGNAVWLAAEKTSPFNFYQFWLNVEDEKAVDYLKIYTLMPLPEIDELTKEHQSDPAARVAQKRLAFEVTGFVHGRTAAEAAEKISSLLFEGGDLSALDPLEHQTLLANAPSCAVAAQDTLIDVLVRSGLALSKREARDFVTSGGVTLNGEKLIDPAAALNFTDLAILKRGKKNLVLLTKA